MFIQYTQAKIYIFDDQDEDIFIQADSHSDRLCRIIEDINLVPQFSIEGFDAIEKIEITKNKMGNYADGSSHLLANVCGKVAIFDQLEIENTTENVLSRKPVFKTVIDKLFNFFNVNFVLVVRDTYYPKDNQWPFPKPQTDEQHKENKRYFKKFEMETIKELQELGFETTGRETFILNERMTLN